MRSILLILPLLYFYNSALSQQARSFSEGVIISRTVFTGHPLTEVLQQVSFRKDSAAERSEVIDALKRHQGSITGSTEQEVKDAFFVSAIMLMPIHTEFYYQKQRSFTRTFALGYHQETLLDQKQKTGKMVISDRDNINQGTIHFELDDVKEVWQKYQIDAAQYSIQKTNETMTIAGYPCKKIVYTFGGTSRGAGVSSMIINMLPLKVTAWINDDLDPLINQMHFIDFEMKKAVLKYEAVYDNNGKNKMTVEVIKTEPKQLEEELFDVKTMLPEVKHNKGGYESIMVIMQVMTNALARLTN